MPSSLIVRLTARPASTADGFSPEHVAMELSEASRSLPTRCR
jgi:hypothetical protein